MIHFLKYVLKIFLAVILLLVICDFVYTEIYYNSKPRNKMALLASDGYKSYDVVFLGSSRVENHIDPALFKKLSGKSCINLGIQDASLNDNLVELELLLANGKITNLYLQLDFNFNNITPSKTAMAGAMPFLRNKILKDHGNNSLENFNKLFYIPFYRYSQYDPKIGFRELMFSLINKKPIVDPSIGFSRLEGNAFGPGQIMPTEVISANESFDRIRVLCREKNVNLVLFTSPVCSKTHNIFYFTRLKEKFPEIINLSEGYDDSLFFNCSHLNAKGAEVFTSDLYNASKQLLK